MTVELTNMCMVRDPETGKVAVLDKIGSGWGGLTFPGGHVEERESFAQATIREIREETGLIISNPRLCGIVHWHNTDDETKYLVMLYKTDRFTGALCGDMDEGRVSWMDIDEMVSGRLAPNMEAYLKVFLTDEFHEIYVEWNSKEQQPLLMF